jgi:alpha-glucoside transport system substrate-binding protein
MKRAFSLSIVMAILAILMMAPVSAQEYQDVAVGDQPERFSWDSYEEFAAANDFTGQELEIFGPWIAADQTHIEAVIALFEEATGADITYSGSNDAEQLIQVRVAGGDPPDVYVFPQPGAAADFASEGNLIPLGDETGQWVVDNYAAGADWASFGTLTDENGEDQFFIFPYKQDLKSLVWYVPDNFTDAGYDIPTSMEELIALSEQIVADGGTPWCIGVESGGATGWSATDWMEDLMLRKYPTDIYDAWVTNDLPFNSEEVVDVMNTFGSFLFTDGWVAGGSSSVTTTSFGDSPAGLFTIPPQCYMHRQASFIPSFFPEGLEAGLDYNAFYFPSYEMMDLGNPVLGAGTLFGIFVESDVAHGFIDFLKTPIANEIWMSRAGLLTANMNVNPDAYANDLLKAQGETLLGATTFRFDGSDLMPTAIGAGSFWSGMVDFINGADAQAVADAIQESWDSIK